MHMRPLVLLAFASTFAGAPTGADSLENVLARMDRGGAAFKALSADVRSVAHTAVINDDMAETGHILLKRTKHGMDMLLEIMAPDSKSVALQEHKAEIYYPKMQTIDEYDISRYRALLDQFLLIGFGTSGKELALSYNMKVLGADTVAGRETTRLELIPKSAEVLKNLKKLELWIPESEVYPVQQQFYMPGGDYKLVTYTNVRMNPPLSDSDLKLKVPKNVKRVYPQK